MNSFFEYYDGNDSNNLSKNIEKIIKKQEKTRILMALGCDEKYTNGKVSLFELFCKWEEILPLIDGTQELENYKNELSLIGMELPPFDENSRYLSCLRWREINKEMFVGTFEDDGTQIPFGECYRYTEKRSYETIFDIIEIVSKYINTSQTYSELCDLISTEIFDGKRTEYHLNFEILDGEYSRPDRYSAEKVYNKIKCDEKLNSIEEFVFLAQLLIELIIKEKSRNTVLHFSKKTPIKCIEGLLIYLASRSLFCGEVRVEVDRYTDMNEFFLLVDKLYPKIKVFPVLTKKEDGEYLFSKYPKGAFYIY